MITTTTINTATGMIGFMPAKNPTIKPNPIPNIAITNAKGLEEINLELLGISFNLR